MSPTPFEQTNDLGDESAVEIESMERSGEAFRESPCFLGSFDWMHFSAFAFPKAPATSVGHLPRPFPLSPLSHPLAHDYTRTAWARARRLSITNSRRRNREEEIAREIQIVYPLKRC